MPGYPIAGAEPRPAVGAAEEVVVDEGPPDVEQDGVLVVAGRGLEEQPAAGEGRGSSGHRPGSG